MKRVLGIFTLVLTFVFFSGLAFANGDEPNLQLKLDRLMKQLDNMEDSMKAQKREIEALQKKIKDMKPGAQPAAAAPGAGLATSKYNIKIYGKIKMDAIYDTNNMGLDEFIKYIPRNADGKDKSTFNIRDTRLGVAIDGPSAGGWAARGRFETDFYGSGDNLRIRLAYIDLEKDGTLIRVGQDWIPVASLNPSTIDFGIMSYNGNIWNRVPQITLKQNLGAGFQGLVSVYRYRWAEDDDTFGGAPVDTQIHMPWVAAKVGYSGKLLDPGKNAYVALGGAVRNGEAADNDVTPYVAALELKLPLFYVDLTAEGFVGRGLGKEYYHTGGSFNAAGESILTKGGFVQLNAKPMKDVQVNLGYGMEDPKDEEVGDGFFQKSRYMFGNVMVELFKDITAGFEVADVKTDWLSGSERGTRYQGSLMYNW
jgi:hypothetical protein